MKRDLPQNEMVEELMTWIETLRLSELLQALAKQCEDHRFTLIRGGCKDARDYMSNQQIALESVAEILKNIEKAQRQRDDG